MSSQAAKYIYFIVLIPIILAFIAFIRYLFTLPSSGILALAMLIGFGYFGTQLIYQGVLGIKNKNMILMGRTTPNSKIKGKSAVFFGFISFLFGIWIVSSVMLIAYFAFWGK